MPKTTRRLMGASAVGVLALGVLLGLGAGAPAEQWEYAVMSISGDSVTLNTGDRVAPMPRVNWNRTGGDDARRQRAITHLNSLGDEGWQVVSTSGTLVQGRVFLQRRR